MNILFFIILLDGSQLQLKTDNIVIDLKTKYGILRIPLKEVESINFGIHVDNPKLYEDMIANLNSDIFAERDLATKFLKHNKRGAYKYLSPLKTTENPEVRQRIDMILDNYKDTTRIFDQLIVTNGMFEGEIVQKELIFESEALGKLKIRLSEIQNLSVKNEFTIKAEDDWTSVRYIYNKLTVKASGEVDLYYLTPLQYVSGPNGIDGSYNNGFRGGSLLGRINGNIFVIGASCVIEQRGQLEIKIHGSPWDNVKPKGSYKIKIQ